MRIQPLSLISMILAVMVLGGCVPPSLNVERSTYRSIGDVAVTLYLDDRKLEDVDARKEQLQDIVGKIAAFLNDGNVSDFTDGRVSAAILKIVPEKYKEIGRKALAVLSAREVKVNAGKIGENNLARLKAFARGASIGLEMYNKDHRPPVTGTGMEDSEGGAPDAPPSQPEVP